MQLAQKYNRANLLAVGPTNNRRVFEGQTDFEDGCTVRKILLHRNEVISIANITYLPIIT